MLVREKVEIKLAPSNMAHYLSKGYKGNSREIITVWTSDLNSSSKHKVLRECDECGGHSRVQFHRLTPLCNDCKANTRKSAPAEDSKVEVQHYTYMLIDTTYNKLYVGVRSCECSPEDDIKYMSSSKVIARLLKEGDCIIQKVVLGTYETRELAEDAEAEHLVSNNAKDNELYYNKSNGKVRAVKGEIPIGELIEYLDEYFTYGDKGFYWKKLTHHSSRVAIGSRAGTRATRGYRKLILNHPKYGKVAYFEHILVWIYHNRVKPTEVLDHKDHDKANNSIANLREVSQLTNCRNKPMSKNNTSGFTGVGFDKRYNKWYASIRVNGKPIALGSYKDKNGAIDARKAANVKYGFHDNHGTKGDIDE